MIWDFIVKYSTEIIIGGMLSGALLLAKNWITKFFVTDQKSIKGGLRVILFDRLTQMHCFYIEQGWMSIDDYKKAIDINNNYHALGGNGAAKDIMHDFENLPRYEPKKGE